MRKIDNKNSRNKDGEDGVFGSDGDSKADGRMDGETDSRTDGEAYQSRETRPSREDAPARETGVARRRITLQVKSNDEWIRWLDRFSKSLGVKKSKVVDIAVERLAKTHGFEKPPKR